MFNIDGESLNIGLDMGLDDVVELKNFIDKRLEYIEEIGVNGELDTFTTSALLQLLFSLKKSKPSLKIPIIDEKSVRFKEFGQMKWVRDE